MITIYPAQTVTAFPPCRGGSGYGGYFYNAGDSGYWWSASEYDDGGGAYSRYMDYGSDAGRDSYVKSTLFSVRCVRD
jgi:hypothetical protein